jgi:hypothetical protein
MAGGLDLGKQVGPLPLGVWIAVGAGGLALGYVINKKMAASSAAAAAQPSTGQLTESGVGTGGSQFIFDPPTSGTVDTAPETNASWGRKAATWLISQNHDPTLADQAVRKYLSALPLTVAEKATMALVMQHMGPPPEPLPPVEEVEQPPTSTPTTGQAPKSATGLMVVRSQKRNTVIWKHDGKYVTRFVVAATITKTGSKTTTIVPAAWGANFLPIANTYTWDHFEGQGTSGLHIKYEVTPFNTNENLGYSVRGPSAYTEATFLG